MPGPQSKEEFVAGFPLGLQPFVENVALQFDEDETVATFGSVLGQQTIEQISQESERLWNTQVRLNFYDDPEIESTVPPQKGLPSAGISSRVKGFTWPQNMDRVLLGSSLEGKLSEESEGESDSVDDEVEVEESEESVEKEFEDEESDKEDGWADEETEDQTFEEGLDEPEEIDLDDPCSQAEHEVKSLVTQIEQANYSLAHSQLYVLRLGREISKLERELQEKELDLQEVQNAQSSMNDWVSARSGSFAWQLSDALKVERKRAQDSRETAESWLRSGRSKIIKLLLPESVKQRLWPRLATLLAFIVTVNIFADVAKRLPRFNVWAQYLPSSWALAGFSALILTGFGLGIWLRYERSHAARAIHERYEARQVDKVQGLDAGQHALALIDFTRHIVVPIPLIIAVVYFVEWMRDLFPVVVAAYFPAPWQIWVIAGVIYLIIFWRAWFNYYRFISTLRHQLLSVIHEASRQSAAYRHASTEEIRLESMHGLLPDYLEMLGKPINKPWLVDLSQVKEGEMRPEGVRLPASVGLAEATGGEGHHWHLMEAKSRALLFKRGWVTQAFSNILERIAEREGLNPRELTPDTLAADPGDSRRGQRKLVSEQALDPVVLSLTGRSQLRELSANIQRGVIRKVKPLVEPLRADELANLDVSTSRFRIENPGQVPWNEFLQQALCEAAPFSPLAFSPLGISSGSYKVSESHALVPNDLIDMEISKSVKVIESEEGGANTPLDLVIRIDRSGWLKPEMLLLFTGVDDLASQIEKDLEETEIGAENLSAMPAQMPEA